MELQGLIRNNNYYNLIVNVLFIVLLLFFTFPTEISASGINNTPIGIAEKTINEVLEVSKTNFIDNGDKIFPFDEIKTNLNAARSFNCAAELGKTATSCKKEAHAEKMTTTRSGLCQKNEKLPTSKSY